MNTAIKKSILLLAVFVLFGFANHVQAQIADEGDIEIDVEYGSGNNEGESINGNDLFDEENVYPGWKNTERIIVVNESENYITDLYIKFSLDNGNTLADELKVYVIRESDGSYRVGGAGDKYTLKEADEKGSLYIGKLDPREDRRYKIKLKFDEDADNDSQGKSTQFDMDFTLEGNPSDGATEEEIFTAQGRTVTGEVPGDEKEDFVTEDRTPESAAIVHVGENAGNVLGASACRSWPFWAWLVVMLSYAGISYVIGRRAKNVSDSKRNLLWQGLVLLGAIGLWYFFDTCRTYTWVPILASVVGVVLALVLFNKKSGNTPPTQTQPQTTSDGPRVT